MTRPNPLKMDPTRTKLERRALEREMVRRFTLLKQAVKKLIVVDDVFGRSHIRNLASTQVNITDPSVKNAIKSLQSRLDPADVVELENTPHITVRYGIENEVEFNRVQAILAQHGRGVARLGNLSVFSNEKQDVLKVDVYSTQLHSIHAHLGILPNKSSFHTYVPHLTVAYLKPGTGHKYTSMGGLAGTVIEFDRVYYSDDDRNQTEVLLTNVSPVTNTPWEFLTTDEQLQSFLDWLKSQVNILILAKAQSMALSDPEHWLTFHIENVYRKALGRAFDSVRHPELADKMDFYQGRREEFLRSSFSRPVSKERVKLLAARTFNDLSGVSDAMATQMQRTLVDGFIKGESPFEIARALNHDVDNIGIKRAKTIARTEIVRAHNEGQLDGLEALDVESVGVAVEWAVSGIGITGRGNPSPCDLCAPLAKTVFTIKEARGLLPRHPNCVLASSKIVAGTPHSVMCGEFTGEVVEIVTAQGGRISVTENHVLLTQRGWVKAKEITDSDYLFYASQLNRDISESPDYNLNVPCIEDVYRSLLKLGAVRFECGSDSLASEDFHGDGKSFDTKVSIVDVYGFLRDKTKALSDCQREKLSFMFGNSRAVESLGFSGKSSLSLFLLTVAASADSFMGFEDISSIKLRGSCFGVDSVGFLSVSEFNSCSFQSSSYGHVGHVESVTQLPGRYSGLVEIDQLLHLLRTEFYSKSGRSYRTVFNGHSRGSEFSTKDVGIAMEHLSDFCERFVSSRVNVDCFGKERVILTTSTHVKSLPVYDVETKESIYILNGFLSSNCMCSWIPAGVGEDTTEQKRTKSQIKDAVARSLRSEVQRKTLPDRESKWIGSKTQDS